ncbi:hypothetical protein [Chryseobacterium arachidis]|nr:hypothetical protein [Chryseobacterium arachidis]
MSTDDSSDIDFTANIFIRDHQKDGKTLRSLERQAEIDCYNHSRPHFSKIRALSESDSENDDNVETSASPEFAMMLRDEFWKLVSGFVTIFHDKQNAVSFAHSEHLILSYDDLYIQYRVIRL